MRTLFFLFSVVVFAACNNSSDKKGDGLTDTTQKPGPGNEQSTTAADTVFTAFGNEPFWALYVIRGSKLLFHPADGGDVEVPYVEPAEIDATTRRYSSVGDSATIELTITRKDCSDGMSDLTHKFQTQVKVNAVTYEGCGRE
jgi:uncharacterized membrane protein